VHRQIFSQNLRNGVNRLLFVFIVIMMQFGVIGFGQDDGALRVSYFVSPEYPRLARQAMMSGDVALTVTVDAAGTPKDIVFKAPYALLGEGAKEAVSKWRFNPALPSSTRKGFVFIHYSFSGTPRDCNPSTVVAADLENMRVIVTVDPRPPFDPDAFPATKNPAKRD
jgi:TonB family protein